MKSKYYPILGNSTLRIADHPANIDFLGDNDEGLSLIINENAPPLNQGYMVGREIEIKEGDVKKAISQYLSELNEIIIAANECDVGFYGSIEAIQKQFGI